TEINSCPSSSTSSIIPISLDFIDQYCDNPLLLLLSHIESTLILPFKLLNPLLMLEFPEVGEKTNPFEFERCLPSPLDNNDDVLDLKISVSGADLGIIYAEGA
ncbi:MAG: hypothetical protein EZS28_045107, partial [Streblomastix strix]